MHCIHVNKYNLLRFIIWEKVKNNVHFSQRCLHLFLCLSFTFLKYHFQKSQISASLLSNSDSETPSAATGTRFS